MNFSQTQPSTKDRLFQFSLFQPKFLERCLLVSSPEKPPVGPIDVTTNDKICEDDILGLPKE